MLPKSAVRVHLFCNDYSCLDAKHWKWADFRSKVGMACHAFDGPPINWSPGLSTTCTCAVSGPPPLDQKRLRHAIPLRHEWSPAPQATGGVCARYLTF